MSQMIRFLTEGAGAIVGFLIALVPLIALHELGHMFTAKALGVWVREFGIGFPPRIKKLFQWQETEFTLNWIPLGGFARLEGEITFAEEEPKPAPESPEQVAEAAEARRHSLYAQSPPRRLLIFLGGPLMNLLTAWVLAIVMFLPGMPVAEAVQVRITAVAPGSPAELAGIQPGDVIVAVDGLSVSDDVDVVVERARVNAGVAMPLIVRRGETELEVWVTPRLDPPPGEGAIGIGLAGEPISVRLEPLSFSQIVTLGTQQFFMALRMIVQAPVQIIRGLLPLEEARPIGIVNISRMSYQTLQQSVATGTWFPIMSLVLAVSLSLGIFNLLPIPALDGGRILFTVVEIVRRKPLTPALEERIHQVALMFLLMLFLVITVMDFMFPVNLFIP